MRLDRVRQANVLEALVHTVASVAGLSSCSRGGTTCCASSTPWHAVCSAKLHSTQSAAS